jgi:amidase
MDEIIGASALSLGRAIRDRRVSSAEVVAAYLEQIDQVNPAINAVVQRVDERARAAAAAADAALARGETGGLFHGVPFTVKDIFDVAGVVSAAGLEERADYVPERDAVVVTRMRAAGAILLGKTNCPPWGAGSFTENPLYGVTRNPYDLDRSPSGSSGGKRRPSPPAPRRWVSAATREEASAHPRTIAGSPPCARRSAECQIPAPSSFRVD